MAKSRQAKAKFVNIGGRLRQARVSQDLTQHELAAKAGIAQAAISQIENSVRRHPNLATILKLEQALGDSSVRLYDDPLSQVVRRAFAKFLASELACELHITPEEAGELSNWRWYASNEVPSDAAWADFVRLRRRVRT